MLVKTETHSGASRALIALIAAALAMASCLSAKARVAYADEAMAAEAVGASVDDDAADTARLKEHMRAASEEERKSKTQITTNMQTEDREIDFVSICCESGDLDIELTISYANGEPSKAHEDDYLYVRLDVDGEEGFKWLSPVIDGDTLSYSFHMDRGKRAAFWIFDYPLERENDIQPTLSIKATDRKGRQVYGTTVGSFRSTLEDWGDGTFFLSNARVDSDAADKAGLPNAKIVLSVLGDDDNQEPNPSQDEDTPPSSPTDTTSTTSTDNPPSPNPQDSDATGGKINWGDPTKVPQLGDSVVLVSLSIIIASLIAMLIARHRKNRNE